jgi:hypothetical protein
MSYQSYNQEDTVLTEASGYEVNNVVFSKPVQCNIPGSNPQMFFKRISVATRNPNGTVADLVLPTSQRFCFGLSENTDPNNNERVTGYSMGICMWTRKEDGGPTEEEKAWTDTFQNIVDHCKKHLLNNKDELEKWELDGADLKKFGNCMYWKKDKGAIVPGVGPTLYVKLMTQKRAGITTKFYRGRGEMDPLELKGNYCKIVAAVKIESIFVGGAKITLIVKLKEAEVQLLGQSQKRLLPLRSIPERQVKASTSETPHDIMGDEDDDDDIGDDDGGDNSGYTSPVEARPPPKTVVKRVVKRVVRKKQ